MAEQTRLAEAAALRRAARASAVSAYTRPKTTPRRVVWVDRAADWVISVGGLAVILAVFGIMAFLVQVVVPLFSGGSVLAAHRYPLAALPGRLLTAAMDEYGTVGVRIASGGEIETFHLPTGRSLSTLALHLGDAPVTAFARTLRGGHLVFGFADGTVRFGRLSFRTDLLGEADVPADVASLGGGDRSDGRSIYSALPGGQVRRVTPGIELLESQPASPAGLPIVAVDYRVGGSVERPSRAFVTVDASGAIVLTKSESRLNLLTRELTTQVRESRLPLVESPENIAGVLLTELGDLVYVAERDGRVHRFDVRDFSNPALVETLDVAPGEAEITSIGFLIGEQSLVVGTSQGEVDVYFRVEDADAGTADGRVLVRAHRLEPHGAAVTAFAASERSKLFVTGDASGEAWLRHSTSERVALRPEGGLEGDVLAVSLSPRDDGILAVGAAQGAAHWRVSMPHPETSLQTIFGRVWYEGYPEPTYTWQSSSGTDVFEPKFSLVPLVFGTLKATLYSLLFAVPIALLAAVYTSEFVHPRVRATVKPVMEMMASLPSVVLGFIAALVLAPVVETWIAAVLLLFLAVPLSLLAGAHLWQLLPQHVALRLDGLPKLALVFLAVGLGGAAAFRLGPGFERVFFGGDLRAWLDGALGTGTPFLCLLLLLPSFAGVNALASRLFGARLTERIRALDRTRGGLLDGARWLAVLGASAGVAWGLAAALAAFGVDPRGGPVGTYVQRNTLVVGFAMGFAVIPIIYTIAEDAMSAVPAHLRAASLACGATPWQTAVSVIVPTAMSGIFAAIMVGMGRAVGETMIVVMAAGNTPILDWNLFNGLRALSANIAVELPEAVKDGSLYRMLFLAALVLFAMTFVVNTLAELVRLRFRRRAAQL
jgi:phosphate transport system permease protein